MSKVKSQHVSACLWLKWSSLQPCVCPGGLHLMPKLCKHITCLKHSTTKVMHADQGMGQASFDGIAGHQAWENCCLSCSGILSDGVLQHLVRWALSLALLSCSFPGGSKLVINILRQARKSRKEYKTSLYDIPLTGFPSAFATWWFHVMTHL